MENKKSERARRKPSSYKEEEIINGMKVVSVNQGKKKADDTYLIQCLKCGKVMTFTEGRIRSLTRHSLNYCPSCRNPKRETTVTEFSSFDKPVKVGRHYWQTLGRLGPRGV